MGSTDGEKILRLTYVLKGHWGVGNMTQPHILVVDDDPSLCPSLQEFFVESKYTVSTTISGEEGVALCASLCPHLVILDLFISDLWIRGPERNS